MMSFIGFIIACIIMYFVLYTIDRTKFNGQYTKKLGPWKYAVVLVASLLFPVSLLIIIGLILLYTYKKVK